jgi:wyosine [tRNA(Phe)-imidazoG37] synthetase (radical SAM superfamily)
MYAPEEIIREVKQRVEILRHSNERIDYLTFVPDGEPTLDIHLGEEIDQLQRVGIPVAVITNSSLLSCPDVRDEVRRADLVSLKIDTVEKRTWKQMNRPHPTLSLDLILSGIQEFSDIYRGTLLTETMLVQGVNDGEEEMERIAHYLSQLQPDRAYLAIPIRPPAEAWVMPPSEEKVTMAYHILKEAVGEVEHLTGYEGAAFSRAGSVTEELLGITSVHPMREEAVREFIHQAGANWEVVTRLCKEKKLREISYRGYRYYLRKFS